jgi:hypothetical protein
MNFDIFNKYDYEKAENLKYNLITIREFKVFQMKTHTSRYLENKRERELKLQILNHEKVEIENILLKFLISSLK